MLTALLPNVLPLVASLPDATTLIGFLPDTPTLAAEALAAVGFVLVPGPDTAFVVAHVARVRVHVTGKVPVLGVAREHRHVVPAVDQFGAEMRPDEAVATDDEYVHVRTLGRHSPKRSRLTGRVFRRSSVRSARLSNTCLAVESR